MGVSEMNATKMMPIGPLMIEHRLIEKMIALLAKEADRIEREKTLRPEFINTAVDFIRTYADKCHHGKEEDILFKALAGKKLSPEHRKTLNELIEEHKYGRKVTAELVAASEPAAAVKALRTLAEFYPRHIEKEDKHFFIPVMAYFTKQEQDAMLAVEYEFDRQMIHDIYKAKVAAWSK